jgi:hypothetical protein
VGRNTNRFPALGGPKGSAKVASARMQTASKKTGHWEVDQGFNARKLVESIVENELNDDIDSMPSSGRLGPY